LNSKWSDSYRSAVLLTGMAHSGLEHAPLQAASGRAGIFAGPHFLVHPRLSQNAGIAAIIPAGHIIA
jgi:hypothetical protein